MWAFFIVFNNKLHLLAKRFGLLRCCTVKYIIATTRAVKCKVRAVHRVIFAKCLRIES